MIYFLLHATFTVIEHFQFFRNLKRKHSKFCMYIEENITEQLWDHFGVYIYGVSVFQAKSQVLCGVVLRLGPGLLIHLGQLLLC